MEVIQAERMPATARTARFVMMVELAFSLVGLAIMIGTAAAAFSVPFLLLFLYAGSITALMGWLLSRWLSRRKFVRSGAIAVEVVAGGGYLAMAAIDGDLAWIKVLGPNTLLPLVVVAALLMPSAARWFDR
ncbi:hypothetical protein [Nonomuraea lactucae]|uniref:hypothetical protein n=1 Tax=Nonomuraea lactucae TaxID=2249762 RepID=UPI000DE39DF4|nr:hypothetical protein [Nonomuraea lactucae]